MAIFAGCRSTRARLERLAHELFACYERFPDLESTRCDRRKLPVLDQEMAKFVSAFGRAGAPGRGAGR
jgi:hypothetical protein